MLIAFSYIAICMQQKLEVKAVARGYHAVGEVE